MSKIVFDFRRIQPSDFNQLQELHNQCFNQIVTNDYFQWKYKDNPAGEAIGFIAYDGKVAAGFYGVIPESFGVGGKKFTVYQSMDTMTHPHYQKMGLFTTLARMTYQYLTESFGDVYIYGIAGPSSLPGFVNKLNWKLVYLTPYIFLNRYLFFIQYFFRKKVRNVTIREATNQEIDFENLESHRVAPIGPILSKEFLLWRLQQKPESKYKTILITNSATRHLVGWAVITLEKNANGKIEYLRTLDGWSDPHTTLFLNFIFHFYNLQFIYTWKPIQSRLFNVYKKQSFITNPFSFGPFSYHVPFIAYSNVQKIAGFDWFDKINFDIQPLIQD